MNNLQLNHCNLIIFSLCKILKYIAYPAQKLNFDSIQEEEESLQHSYQTDEEDQFLKKLEEENNKLDKELESILTEKLDKKLSTSGKKTSPQQFQNKLSEIKQEIQFSASNMNKTKQQSKLKEIQSNIQENNQIQQLEQLIQQEELENNDLEYSLQSLPGQTDESEKIRENIQKAETILLKKNQFNLSQKKKLQLSQNKELVQEIQSIIMNHENGLDQQSTLGTIPQQQLTNPTNLQTQTFRQIQDLYGPRGLRISQSSSSQKKAKTFRESTSKKSSRKSSKNQTFATSRVFSPKNYFSRLSKKTKVNDVFENISEISKAQPTPQFLSHYNNSRKSSRKSSQKSTKKKRRGSKGSQRSSGKKSAGSKTARSGIKVKGRLNTQDLQQNFDYEKRSPSHQSQQMIRTPMKIKQKMTALQIRNQAMQRTVQVLEEQNKEKDNQIRYLQNELLQKTKDLQKTQVLPIFKQSFFTTI